MTSDAIVEFEDVLLEIISSGSDRMIPTAVLALGVLNAGLVEEQEDSDKSKIVKTLFELVDPKYEERNPISGTLAAIGLGFIHSSKDFLDYYSARPSIKEAIAISAGLGSISQPEKIIDEAMQDQAPNVNFGAAVGAGLYMLETGNLPGKQTEKRLENLIESEYYDVAAAALISYGLRPLDEAQAKQSIRNVERFIDFKVGFQKRVSAILSSLLMSTNLTNKIKAMENFHKYLEAGSWAIMTVYACYSLLLSSEREPISEDKFKSYPFMMLPPRTIYDFNGFTLSFAFLICNAAKDLKSFLFETFNEGLAQATRQFADSKFVYDACKGLIAPFAENPKEEILKLLKEDFSAILENDSEDWDTVRLKIGATLGIGLGVFSARMKAGIDDEILQTAYPLLEKAIQNKAILVQKAAVISLLATIARPDMFKKFLLIYSFYELDLGDYTYFNVMLLILAIYFIYN